MLFSSLTFIFGFIPILLLTYFLTKNITWKNAVLLILSSIFYAWGEPLYILLLFLTVIISYVFGILISKKNNKKLLLSASVILILLSLLFFKYGNFIIDILNYVFRINIPNHKLPLPIGISFFTFQTLSYLIDLYRNKVKVQKNIFDLALYVVLFPQLIAGPIVRYETIEEELENRRVNFDDVVYGIKRFIIGLSKKVLIANQMAIIADLIFDSVFHIGTSIAWIGAFAYTFQIYFDFSGYSDMAIGLGRIFGFHFLENFNYPYMASSITDFWRRWHISLSTWFRDYVYIPLGGNRVSKYRHILNLLFVWFLTGLWHGASFNYIIWGMYYGIILIIEKRVTSSIKLNKYFQRVLTIIIIVVGWTIFRIENIGSLLQFIQKMFCFSNSNYVNLFVAESKIFFYMLFFIPSTIFSIPFFQKVRKKYKSHLWYLVIENILILTLFMLCITFLISSNYNPFIYFRF